MRRILNETAALVVRSLRQAVGAWNAFFLVPADPTPLGLVRLIIGALSCWNMIVYGMELRSFLGSTGWADPVTAREFLPEGAWSFWFLVPDSLLRPVWAACVLITFCFAIGLFSRTTAILSWAILVSTAYRAPVLLYGFDQILATWVFYLAITGASGRAVSIDRFLERYRRNRLDLARPPGPKGWRPESGSPRASVAANIAIRLIQLHLCMIYLFAGLSKLRGEPWWDGYAAAMILTTPEFSRFDLTWIAIDYPALVSLATHATIVLEIGYAALIWNRKLRPWVLIAVAAMHVGIDLTLSLTEFALTMLAANIAFVSGTWLRSLASGREQPSGKVLYDGVCPRCRATMSLVCAADPDRVIEPVDLTSVDVASIHPELTKEACMASMHVVRRDGRLFAGYDAVMILLAWTPLTWPLSLFRFIPGVAPLGRRVYNTIAATRPRDVPCTDEVCGIHPPASIRGDSAKPARLARNGVESAATAAKTGRTKR